MDMPRPAHVFDKSTALFARIQHLILPPSCYQCGALMDPLLEKGPGFPYLCAPCWETLPGDGISKIELPEGLEGLWCGTLYQNPLRKWLFRLKYNQDTGLSPFLARIMGRAMEEVMKPGENWPFLGSHASMDHPVVIPVPLHKKRLRARGFNQSMLLAHHWLKENALPWPLRGDVLVRHLSTRPQMELTAHERRTNVKKAFSVAEGQKTFIKGKQVLLVDDMLTTGSTLQASAQALKKAGAAKVFALVLAHAEVV